MGKDENTETLVATDTRRVHTHLQALSPQTSTWTLTIKTEDRAGDWRKKVSLSGTGREWLAASARKAQTFPIPLPYKKQKLKLLRETQTLSAPEHRLKNSRLVSEKGKTQNPKNLTTSEGVAENHSGLK